MGARDWTALHDSGLYAALQTDGLVVEHEPAPIELAAAPGAAAVIRPREIAFVSYPYEWCFGQLRAAALLTLELQERALNAGMRLKDASAYNIAIDGGRPILLDSLSFEVADPAEPWPAYRQFCEHFLAPLALMAFRDTRCGLLLRDLLDGIPVDLAGTLLPWRSWLNLGVAAHVHLHGRAQRRSRQTDAARATSGRVSGTGQRALLDALRRTVTSLRWTPRASTWLDYDPAASYSPVARSAKEATVREMLRSDAPGVAWDLGANVGAYSALAAEQGWRVVALDQDAASVELHWQHVLREGRGAVLPLVQDLANPSPALGWAHRERRSLLERGPADIGLALALVHHLAIGRNVPFARLATFMAAVARRLIIEFVPKEDPMAQRLLATRRDVFADYDLDAFRVAFAADFSIRSEVPLPESSRVLFLMDRR